MTKHRYVIDRGLERAVMETRLAIKYIAEAVDSTNTKLNYVIESLRYCVPQGCDYDQSETPSRE